MKKDKRYEAVFSSIYDSLLHNCDIDISHSTTTDIRLTSSKLVEIASILATDYIKHLKQEK